MQSTLMIQCGLHPPSVPPPQIKGVLRRDSTVLDTCHGNWLHYLDWEKGVGRGKTKRVWDYKHSVPMLALPVENAAPSDSKHRQDLLYLKEGDQAQSQVWKVRLEEQQRKDRKLRKEGGCTVEQ